MTTIDLQKKKQQQKISFITCYDYPTAKIIANTAIDAVLVGDSLAMVVHGHPSTIHATLPMMVMHTAAVARGINNKLIIADLPFLSYRKSLAKTCAAAGELMLAGANGVKMEGAQGNLSTIEHLVTSGIPVMGHIGLTPQSVNVFGGHKIQGRHNDVAVKLLAEAIALEQAGCFAIVIECVPWQLAKQITDQLTVPTIGIGAGPHTSGQIMVLHDILGIQQDFNPKFLKRYLDSHTLATQAINNYAHEVASGDYPSLDEHSYT